MVNKRRVVITSLLIVGALACIAGGLVISDQLCRSQGRREKSKCIDLYLWMASSPEWPTDVIEPESGRALLSWRAVVVDRAIPHPYWIERTGDARTDKNIKLAELGQVGNCASQPYGPPIVWAIIGQDTAFDRARQGGLRSLKCVTALLIQTSKGKGLWTAPGDLPIEELLKVPGASMADVIGNPSCGSAFHVVFSNGQAVWLSTAMPTEAFYRVCVEHKYSDEELNRIIAPFRLDSKSEFIMRDVIIDRF